MKKVYIVLAIILSLFYFTGCSGNDSGNSDTNKKDQEKTEVKKGKNKSED